MEDFITAEDGALMTSRFRDSFARRNTLRRFLAITERGKEAVWCLVQFLIACAVVAYFGAHFIVYLVSDKYPQQQTYIYQHEAVIAHH